MGTPGTLAQHIFRTAGLDRAAIRTAGLDRATIRTASRVRHTFRAALARALFHCADAVWPAFRG